ncbi:WD40-repeat-containing domain protein [Globomyces pollinis-pini]|nr:WD40-repeat-containing domain protein [Globomyces pollinis-pini]
MDLFNIVTGLIKTIDKTSTSILSSISFNFAVKKLASVGLEGLPTAIAWDPSQSLIAIASDTGKILLIGKSVEVMLESPKNWLNSPITHLLFEIGDAKLVAVNDSSQLGLWDISSFQGVCVDLKDPILNVQLYPTSSWIVLAFTSGLVKLMDINSLTYSNLLVPCDLNPDHRLNSIDINPSNFTQLLMGFDNEIIIWDFAQQRPNARFTHDDSKVISVRWDPEGVRFLSGHSSGELLVWTTKKKTTFLGSGKQPTKPVYETKFSSINHLDWIYVDEKRSTILIAGDQCVESLTVTSTDYKSAIKWTISLESPLKEFIFFSLEKDEYSIVAITSQKKLMHYTSTKVKKIELPSTLQFLSKSNHYNSTVCPDGFNLSSVVTRNIQKTYLLNSDASMILSNIEKNYDTMCISRKGELEFWLLSLPIPQYLYSIPVADTLDLSEALVSFDMMTNKLTIVSGNILNVYKFVGHQDPEAMMDNLDAALDQLMADTKIIQQLHSKPGQPDHDSKSDLVIVNQSEVDTDSYADQLVESGDSSPHSEIKTNGPSSNSKDANEKITNEPLDSIINSQRNSISLDFNPPFHLEDSYWISQVQITLNKPIISHSASLQLEILSHNRYILGDRYK